MRRMDRAVRFDRMDGVRWFCGVDGVLRFCDVDGVFRFTAMEGSGIVSGVRGSVGPVFGQDLSHDRLDHLIGRLSRPEQEWNDHQAGPVRRSYEERPDREIAPCHAHAPKPGVTVSYEEKEGECDEYGGDAVPQDMRRNQPADQHHGCQHDADRYEVAGGKRQQRGPYGPSFILLQTEGHGKEPAHCGIDSVKGSEQEHGREGRKYFGVHETDRIRGRDNGWRLLVATLGRALDRTCRKRMRGDRRCDPPAADSVIAERVRRGVAALQAHLVRPERCFHLDQEPIIEGQSS